MDRIRINLEPLTRNYIIGLQEHTHKNFNNGSTLKIVRGKHMGLGLNFFNMNKKRAFIMPPPPEDLPTFPSPKDSEYDMPPPESDLDELKEAAGVSEKHEEPEEVHTREYTAPSSEPVYLKIQLFKAAVAELHQLRASLSEAEERMLTLEETDRKQERMYRDWHDCVKEIHNKIVFVDESLFKRG